MIGSERRILEIERRLEQQARDADALRRRLTAAEQLARQLAGAAPPAGGGEAGFLCRADGGISARSGITPGAGDVKRVRINAGDLEAVGDPIPVKNASATAMDAAGIDDGTYCWAVRDPFGAVWVFPLECPDDVDPSPGGP